MQRVNSFYRQKERPLARPSGEEDDLSSSKGRRNTQSNLRERLTKISDEIIVKKKENNELDKSKNDNNSNLLKT